MQNDNSNIIIIYNIQNNDNDIIIYNNTCNSTYNTIQCLCSISSTVLHRTIDILLNGYVFANIRLITRC